MKRLAIICSVFLLGGCLDQFTNKKDPAIRDAEAIGFACRLSDKSPETCMKEYNSMSPAAILDGWKAADVEVKEHKAEAEEKAAKEGKKPEGETKPAAKEESKGSH